MAYFDNNATTPLAGTVFEAFQTALEKGWANPSSPYRQAARVRAEISRSSGSVGGGVWGECVPSYFVSGATESNNAVFSYFAHKSSNDSRVLISSIEHPSVSAPAKWYFPERVDLLETDGKGIVSLEALESFLQSENKTILGFDYGGKQ